MKESNDLQEPLLDLRQSFIIHSVNTFLCNETKQNKNEANSQENEPFPFPSWMPLFGSFVEL